MDIVLNLDDFISDVDELTHEIMSIEELKLSECIEKRVGLYHFNNFVDFLFKQDSFYDCGIVGLTKGKPETAERDEVLTSIWLDGRFCSYSHSESGLFYFHVGFGLYIQCGYSA